MVIAWLPTFVIIGIAVRYSSKLIISRAKNLLHAVLYLIRQHLKESGVCSHLLLVDRTCNEYHCCPCCCSPILQMSGTCETEPCESLFCSNGKTVTHCILQSAEKILSTSVVSSDAHSEEKVNVVEISGKLWPTDMPVIAHRGNIFFCIFRHSPAHSHCRRDECDVFPEMKIPLRTGQCPSNSVEATPHGENLSVGLPMPLWSWEFFVDLAQNPFLLVTAIAQDFHLVCFQGYLCNVPFRNSCWKERSTERGSGTPERSTCPTVRRWTAFIMSL